MKYTMRHIGLVAATVAAAACDTPPVAPVDAPQLNMAERTVYEALYDMSDSFYSFSCSEDGEPLPDFEGELIQIQGSIYERIAIVRDASGAYHYHLQTMPVGLRGTGVDSGEEFRVSERQIGTANARLEALNGTYRQELKLVGRDTHRTSWLVFSGVYRVDADGNVTVSRDTTRVVCRPAMR